MLAIDGAVIDESAKPAIEWIAGRAVQKLMPTDQHGILQFAFAAFLARWAKRADGGRGKVITEWRFLIPPNAFMTESVVPDVAYLASYFDLPQDARTYPRIPPDIAVEILSPAESASEIAARHRFFRWWGVKLVLIADPKRRIVSAHDVRGESVCRENDTLTSPAFPTLAIPLREIFAELDEP